MRKKEDWMKKGALVLALGKEGVITYLQENSLNGVDYVYYIRIKLKGKKHSMTYYPTDVSEKIN